MSEETVTETNESETIKEAGEKEEGGRGGRSTTPPPTTIHATRDEAVAEELSDSEEAVGVSFDDDEDEIESMRAELRDSAEDADDDEDESEEDSQDTTDNRSFCQRVIESVRGRSGARYLNLKGHLSGQVALSIKDRGEGYLFSWTGEELEVQPWQKSAPASATCQIETNEHYLEQILRGKLNPQVAMLSHKVSVSGNAPGAMSQAVYFFNLFLSPRQG